MAFDNISVNKIVFNSLRDIITPLHNSKGFFHKRSMCHIINLCVQDDFKFFKNHIEPIKNGIMFISLIGVRTQEYMSNIATYKLKQKTPQTNIATR